MARTLAEIRASRPKLDRAKIGATTEADIRRHADADDSHPAAPLEEFVKRLPGQRGPAKKPNKAQVTLRVDAAALEAWRDSGEGWMTRAAEALARAAPALRADRPTETGNPHVHIHPTKNEAVAVAKKMARISKGKRAQARRDKPPATPLDKRQA